MARAVEGRRPNRIISRSLQGRGAPNTKTQNAVLGIITDIFIAFIFEESNNYAGDNEWPL